MKYVCYHKNCADGFTAAWVFWREWCLKGKEAIGVDVRFDPVQYGCPMPWAEDGVETPGAKDEVYFVDFCPEESVLEQLAGRVSKLVVLDHHATREKMLENWLGGLSAFEGSWDWPDLQASVKWSYRGRKDVCDIVVWFSDDASGARLAWDWFEENLEGSTSTLVDFVEDRDLWRWGLPDSREVNAFIRNHPFDFDRWNRLNDKLDLLDGVDEAYAIGEHLLERDRILVDQMIRRAVMVGPIGEFMVPAVAASILQSEVCEALLHRYSAAPCAACWSDGLSRQGWNRVWSLRSRSGEECDVSALAKAFGGGGHPCASGFREEGLQSSGLLKSAWLNEPDSFSGWATAQEVSNG